MSAAPAEQLRGELHLVQSHEMAAMFGEPTYDVQPEIVRPEVYGKSLSTILLLGEASIEGVGLAEATQLTYDDFFTKLTEMIKTDEDYGHEVDVNRDDKVFDIVDGKVCNGAGVPMVQIVRNGYEASKNSDNPQLSEVHSIRDSGDVIVALEVDRLKPGETLMAISVQPVEQLRGEHGKFWRNLGYRDIAYIQMYCRIDEMTMAANAYSVDHSELLKWRELMISKGVDVPEDVDANTFIRHTYKFTADLETAKQTAQALKREYYESVGVNQEKIDTKKLLADNQDVVAGMFMTYYPKIGKALVTGENNQVLRDFANEALRMLDTTKLKPEVTRQILRIANSSRFDAEMARILSEDLIPYATVETIRRGLENPRRSAALTVEDQSAAIITLPNPMRYERWATVNDQQMHMLALAGIQGGIVAGRSYGGCTGVDIAIEQTEAQARVLGMDRTNQQDIYGGKSGENNVPGDKFGAYVFNCSKCGYKNDRRKEKTGWVMACQGCGTDVSCGKGHVGHKGNEVNFEDMLANVILFPSRNKRIAKQKGLLKVA